jgi:hypothetical protein
MSVTFTFMMIVDGWIVAGTSTQDVLRRYVADQIEPQIPNYSMMPRMGQGLCRALRMVTVVWREKIASEHLHQILASDRVVRLQRRI